MNKQQRASLDAYYVEADSWARSEQDALVRSRRVAWRVAAGAAAIAFLLALALLLLVPLKTVVPVTLLVDRNTGFVQAIEPFDPARISGDTALTQSFLVQYVIARESFDIDMLQDNYRKVGLWSAERARSEYISGSQYSNPDSPLSRYRRSDVVETRVKSVSRVGRNVALVRFETRLRTATGQAATPAAWVAAIRYRFSGEPMALEERFVNPLGFQVVRYRRDAEAMPPDSVTAAPPLPAAPVIVRPNYQLPGGSPLPPAAPVAPPVRPTQPEVEL